MLALLLAGEQVNLFPAIAVRHDVVASLAHFLGRIAVALEGDGAGVEGALHVLLVEDVEQPPVSGARAVFEHRFAGEVALGERPARGPAGFARVIAVADRPLRSLLVVDNQRDRDLGPAGPGDLGRISLVADEVPLRAGDGRNWTVHWISPAYFKRT